MKKIRCEIINNSTSETLSQTIVTNESVQYVLTEFLEATMEMGFLNERDDIDLSVVSEEL